MSSLSAENPERGHLEAFMVAPEIRDCWICGKPTRFLQFDFEAPQHPGECTDRAWREYFEALRANPVGPGTSQPGPGGSTPW